MKKVISVFTALVFSLLSVFSLAYAADFSMDERQLVNVRQYSDSGVTATVSRYYDNGFYVDIITLDAVADNVNEDSLNDALLRIADISQAEFAASQATIRPLADYGNEKDFDSTSTNSQNSYCKARQWGTFYGGTYHYLGVTDGASRAQYTGSATPTKMTITETFTFSGIGLSISWPAGASVSSTSNSYTWTSSAYNNTKMATSYWDDFYADGISTLGIGFSLKCSTRSDIYFGSTSYAASVSNSQAYYGSW